MDQFNDELIKYADELTLIEYQELILPQLFPEINIAKYNFVLDLINFTDTIFLIDQNQILKNDIIKFDDLDDLKSKLLKLKLTEDKHYIFKNENIVFSPNGVRLLMMKLNYTEFNKYNLVNQRIQSNYSKYQTRYRTEVNHKSYFNEINSNISYLCRNSDEIKKLLTEKNITKKTDTQLEKKTVQRLKYRLLQSNKEKRRLLILPEEEKTRGEYKKLVYDFISVHPYKKLIEIIHFDIYDTSQRKIAREGDKIVPGGDIELDDYIRLGNEWEMEMDDSTNEIVLGTKVELDLLIKIIDRKKE